MHSWGDSWPYWDELYQAEHWISKMVRRYSRCRLILKEKYGTLRYEYIFPPAGSVRYYSGGIDKVLSIFGTRTINHPDYPPAVVQRVVWNQTYVYRLWYRFGVRVALYFIKRAAKKFPNVSAEILADLWDGKLCM